MVEANNQHPFPSLSPSRENVPLLSPLGWPNARYFQGHTALGTSPGTATDWLCSLGQIPPILTLNFHPHFLFSHSFVHSLTHCLDKCLLRIYYILGPALGSHSLSLLEFMVQVPSSRY